MMWVENGHNLIRLESVTYSFSVDEDIAVILQDLLHLVLHVFFLTF